jgi:hypothetical protein
MLQKNVVETVKAENVMSEKKSEHSEQQLANEKVGQKNLSISKPTKSGHLILLNNKYQPKIYNLRSMNPICSSQFFQKKVLENSSKKKIYER